MAQRSNREQLVRGAIECLKAKGYAGTTARDIAAASDANLASIGYHFGSKDALLNVALVRLLEQRNRRVGELARGSAAGSPLGYLTATFDAATGVFRSPRPLLVAFVEAVAQAQRDRALREQMAGHYRVAILDLAQALDAHIGGADPEVMASVLLALFDGLLLQQLLGRPVTASGDQLIAALVDLAAPAADGHRQASGPAKETRR